MVKAIVLDVDGVIVGKKKDFNFPLPHEKVIAFLKKTRGKGIPIILCTAKYYYAIEKIIEKANLNNPHITDGGSLIIDPLDNKIISSSVFDQALCKEIIFLGLSNNFFVEAYTVDDYFIQENPDLETYKKRIAILQREPKFVNFNSFFPEKVIKIIFTVNNKKDMEKINDILKIFADKVGILWTRNPSSAPLEYGVITLKGISKKQAVIDLAQKLNIPLKNVLGVGDLIGDWDFMKVCGYAATLADAGNELKNLVKSKGEKFSFIGPSVDNHGIIEIINRFVK